MKRMIFRDRVGIKMATLYPNATIHAILSQLPAGVFSEREMVLSHTTFLYYTRMYPATEREALLDDLLQKAGDSNGK